MNYPILPLKKDQERRLLSGHLWIYTNEIDTQKVSLNQYSPGDLVALQSSRGKTLGIAYINPNTLLCARLLVRDVTIAIDLDFIKSRINQALSLRQRIYSQPFYRLIFSESDLLPGLIIDRYNDVYIGQINTAGMERLQPLITQALVDSLQPKAVIWRNDTLYRTVENLPKEIVQAYGEEMTSCTLVENDCEYQIPSLTGQKTGWFYDHRDNRHAIAKYVNGQRVLDLFAYMGAFAIPAAKAGAQHVTCVDSSALALGQLEQNAKLNQVYDRITTVVHDASGYLKQLKTNNEAFDVVILDPPAFIKRKKDYHAGLRAYEQINQLAMAVLKPGGILLSASCSMQCSSKDLLNCIRKAALSLNRQAIIIEQCHQGRDHPIHPAIEETNYLKGYIIHIS